jgi:outer membrane lipoprotein-sorting protein
MKQFFPFVFCAALAVTNAAPAFSQDSQKILDELSRKAKSYTSITADYSSRLLDKKSAIDLTESGTIKVKGTKYYLDLPSYTIICDGQTVWTFEKENNTVLIDNLADVEVGGMNPNEMFRIWEKGFKHEYKETKNEGGKEVYLINLYPTDPKSKPFHTIQLFVDKAKLELLRLKLMNRDGSEITYTVKTFKPNAELNDAIFRFDKAKHPGVEEVDNRL